MCKTTRYINWYATQNPGDWGRASTEAKDRQKSNDMNTYICVEMGWREKSSQRMASVQIRSFFWSVFPCIRTKYGEIRSNHLNKFLYTVFIEKFKNISLLLKTLTSVLQRIRYAMIQCLLSSSKNVLRGFWNV